MSVLLRGSKRLLAIDLSAATAAAGTTPVLASTVGSSTLGGRHNGSVNSQKRFISVSMAVRSPASAVMMPSELIRKTGTQPPPPGTEGDTIRITEKCKQRLRQILDEKGTFLRVAVEGGGCSGFQYKFEVDNQLGPGDIVIAKNHHGQAGGNGNAGDEQNSSSLVVIDEMSLDLIRGSTLDYETELIRSTFRIVNNPHAEQGCSCGASFNMKL